MKGTIFDFLKLAAEKPELAKELVELAAKYEFEFTPPDELSDVQLDDVAGGGGIARGPTVPDAGFSGLSSDSLFLRSLQVMLGAMEGDAAAQAAQRAAAEAMTVSDEDKASDIAAKAAGGR